MSVTVAQIAAWEAEKERIEDALDKLAREIHTARGQGQWFEDYYHIGTSKYRRLHPYIFDSYSVWNGEITVSYGDHSQSPDWFHVKFPVAWLDETFDWRAAVAEELRAAEDAASAKHENEMRNLV